MLHTTSRGSWGKPRNEIDTRVLRRFRSLLARVRRAGEVLNPILAVTLFGLCAWLVLAANFEDIIPYDGTATTCVLDEATWESANVR